MANKVKKIKIGDTVYNVSEIQDKSVGSGTVNVTVQDGYEYSFSNVSSLTLTGAVANCHGFVTFGSSTPSVNISGFDNTKGDDITEAAAGETWEFSSYAHNGESYIIWLKWE